MMENVWFEAAAPTGSDQTDGPIFQMGGIKMPDWFPSELGRASRNTNSLICQTEPQTGSTGWNQNIRRKRPQQNAFMSWFI